MLAWWRTALAVTGGAAGLLRYSAPDSTGPACAAVLLALASVMALLAGGLGTLLLLIL